MYCILTPRMPPVLGAWPPYQLTNGYFSSSKSYGYNSLAFPAYGSISPADWFPKPGSTIARLNFHGSLNKVILELAGTSIADSGSWVSITIGTRLFLRSAGAGSGAQGIEWSTTINPFGAGIGSIIPVQIL